MYFASNSLPLWTDKLYTSETKLKIFLISLTQSLIWKDQFVCAVQKTMAGILTKIV